MASLSERTRNNVRAGVFVTLALTLAFVVIAVLSEAWTLIQVTNSYTLRFQLSAGVEGLGVGSEVRVGGVRMGRVTKITPELGGDRFKTILVRFEMDRDVKLYDNAVGLRIAPLLGSTAWINFPDVGDPSTGQVLASGATIDAANGLGLLTTLLGPENAANADMIVENATRLSEFLGQLPDEYRQRIVPILDKTDSVMGKANDTVSQIRADYARWSGTIDQVMDRANRIAENLDKAMADGQAGMADLRGMLAENRPKVDAFIDNAAAVSTTLRTETMDKVTALLDRGRDGLDSFARTMETIHGRVDAEIPGLADAMANVRLTAQQLKLTSIELRRSPWKLLYRPGPEELQHELLYEAARQFAVGASDLKAASASLDRVIAGHGDMLAADEPTLRQVSQNLIGSFQNYEKAQQRLFDVLLGEEK